jgi:small subunit ribosomal protein S16
MLVIRLARVGRKKQAHFRLVAADSRRSATAKYVARLGHYDPHSKEAVIDKEAVAKYLKSGAQPSSAAVKLLKREKIALPKWAEANLVTKKKAPKSKEKEAADQAAAPSKAEDTAEAAPADKPGDEAKPAEATEAPDTKPDEANEKPAETDAKAEKAEETEKEAK